MEEKFDLPQWIQVRTFNKIFNLGSIRERCSAYVNRVYCDTWDNRKIRKAFRNQLLTVLREEIEFIRNNMRVHVKKQLPLRKTRKRREYKPTPYILFCREMKEKYDSTDLAGKLQKMWRAKKGLVPKERRREIYSTVTEAKDVGVGMGMTDRDLEFQRRIILQQIHEPVGISQSQARYGDEEEEDTSDTSDDSMDESDEDEPSTQPVVPLREPVQPVSTA